MNHRAGKFLTATRAALARLQAISIITTTTIHPTASAVTAAPRLRRLNLCFLLFSFLLSFFCLLTSAPPAQADCFSPGGQAGNIMYNGAYHVPQYCDGTNWRQMGQKKGVGGSAGCFLSGAPTSGLVGWWKLDDASSGNAVTTAADSSGNSHTGATQGTPKPTWTASGKIGDALILTTTGSPNQYVNVPDVASLDLTGSWTVSTWVKLTTLPTSGNGQSLLARVTTTGPDENYALYVDYGYFTSATSPSFDAHFSYSGGSNVDAFNQTAGISTGTWYLVTGTWNGTTLTLYVNGTSIATSVPGHVPNGGAGATGLFIGSETTSGNYTNGTLDDVRVYNRALSAAEITALYNYTGAATISGAEGDVIYNADKHVLQFCDGTNWIPMAEGYPTSGLAAWWKLDDGSSGTTPTTAVDSSGNGNTGTLTNGPTWTSSGKIGDALNFNGSNNYVSVGSYAALEPGTSDFSLSAWIKSSGVGDFIQSSNCNANCITQGYGLIITSFTCTSGSAYFRFAAGGTMETNYVCSAAPVNDGNWHLITVTVKRQSVQKLYVDGVLSGSAATTVTGSVVFPSFVLGGVPFSGFQGYYPGLLDDVRLYNRALSDAEVAKLAGVSTMATECNSASALVGYWKLDDGTSGSTPATAADSSGLGNNGTLTGTTLPTWTTSGRFLNALNFSNGVNTSMTFPGGNASLQLYGSWTASVWVNPAVLPGSGSYASLLERDATSYYANYALWIDNGTLVNNGMGFAVQFQDTSGVHYYAKYVPTTAIATGTWYLVTGVWDSVGQNLYLYVNGALVATQNESGHAPAAGGNAYSALGGYLNGTLDDARVYNAALSASDIALLYTTTAPVAEGDIMYNANYNVPQFCDGANWNALGRLPLSGGSSSGSNAGSLVGWWKLDDGLPTTISGLTQGGNDACAITAGKLYCWGRNANGNDGLGNTTPYNSPQRVGFDTTWTAISQSDPNQLASACGIDAGNLWCWGANTDGELGLGTTTSFTTPQQVSGTPGGSSLVGWWKFDDGSGTTAADSSGQGNTGALVNGPTWTTGFNNGALGFSSPSLQYVDAGNGSSLSFERTQPFSLAVWAYITAANGYDPLIAKQLNGGNFPGYVLGVDSLNNRITATLQGTSATGNLIFVQTPGNSFSPNAWHHVVMTYDGSSTAAGTHVYIDGAAQTLTVQNDALSSSILNTADMTIGDNPDTGYFLGGTLDDVRVYNTALSATAVTNLYRGFTVPAVFGGDITTGLIHYWKMDAAAGSTTSADSAGSATLTKSGTGGDFAPAFINNGWSIPSGGSGELSVTTPADMLGQSALTISAWVKVGLTTSAMTFYSQSTNESLGVELDGSGNIDFDLANATYAAGNMAVPDTNWHLWTLVFDGTQTGNASRLKGYLDGVQQTLTFTGTIPAATTTYADPFCIGPCDTNPYGIIDEIRVYNRALAALDVAQLYADSFPSASPSSSWTAVSQGGTNACGIAAGALYCWGLNANGELGLGNTTQLTSPQHVTDTPGLVGWWKFDDGSGTSAADSSGYSNTGTLYNSPTWTTSGKINGALSFVGTNAGLVDVGNAANLGFQVNTPFSISAWVYRTGSAAPANIFGKGNGTPGYGLGISGTGAWPNYDGMVLFSLGAATNADYIYTPVAGPTVPVGAWHHVVGTYDGSGSCAPADFKIYIDGVDSGAICAGGNPSGSMTTALDADIGSAGSGTILQMILDDVRVYNRALSATEVAALYAGTSPSPSWTAISQGTNDTCGINAGELFCWGDNYYGEDGLGNTTSPITTPTQVGTDATWTAVSQGIWDTCGIDAGKLYCWGFNHVGELGIGNSTQQTSPVQVTTGPANPASWTAVAIQNDNNGGDADACGIAAGALYCWGSNGQGELGLGALTSWTSVSYSEHDACGVAGGNLYCWGNNAFGEDGLGNTTSPQKSPQPVTVVPTPTTALDSSGNNNTGTLTGSPLPVWTTGKINGALSFNGTTQWVSMGSPSSLKINHLGNQVSLSAWIYWEGHPSGLARIGGFQGYYGDYALWIASDGHILWEVDGQNGNALTTNPATVTQNAWHHIVGTFSQATGLIVYIDGAPRASAAITYYPPTEGAAYLLAVGNQEDYYFNGLIDDVRIYDRALSASEILNLYSDTSGD